MNGSHRVFVAVALDEQLQGAIQDLERRVEESGARLRWIKPENLHFTLRFLGHISDAQLNRVRKATQEAAKGIGAFRISLAGVGAFPNARRPRVVWVGVTDGGDALRGLVARLDDTLARQRFPKEPRGFQPHLTLARIKESAPLHDLGGSLSLFRDVKIGEQEVRSLLVMESLLGPQGAIYAQVEEVPLSTYEK